jgi:membrane protein DedA with SNARE-associated domain
LHLLWGRFIRRHLICNRLPIARYGHYVHLTEARIKLGEYLFRRHGGKIVFFGRFVAVLRALAAVLASANHMSWPRFLQFNAATATMDTLI